MPDYEKSQNMNWRAFFAHVIHSIMWPVVIVIFLFSFRLALSFKIEINIDGLIRPITKPVNERRNKIMNKFFIIMLLTKSLLMGVKFHLTSIYTQYYLKQTHLLLWMKFFSWH